MNKDNKNEVKRCFFCHKKILNNKDFICRRCWLQGKDVGEKVLGTGAAVGSTALLILKLLGSMNQNDNND